MRARLSAVTLLGWMALWLGACGDEWLRSAALAPDGGASGDPIPGPHRARHPDLAVPGRTSPSGHAPGAPSDADAGGAEPDAGTGDPDAGSSAGLDGGEPGWPFELVVSSHDSNDLIRFHRADGGLHWTYLDGPGGGKASWPHGLLETSDGRFIVANRGTDTLLELRTTGAAEFGASPALAGPIALTVDDVGRLYASAFYSHAILRYDLTTGALLDVFAPGGTPGLENPYGMAFGPDGQLYVASHTQGTVLRLDAATGAPLGVFTSGASLSLPTALVFRDGILYVGSFSGGIERFDALSGQWLGTLVTAGSGGLGGAHSFVFAPDGLLYVADYVGDSIRRYDGQTGAFVDTLVSFGHPSLLNGPTWLLVRPLP